MYPIHRSPMIARLAMLAVLAIAAAGVARADAPTTTAQNIGHVTILKLDHAIKTTYTACRIVKEQWWAGSPGVSYLCALCVGNDLSEPLEAGDLPPGIGVQFGSVILGGELWFQSTACWKVGMSLEWDAGLGRDVFNETFACTDSVFRSSFDGG